jgi:hypothetical protein
MNQSYTEWHPGLQPVEQPSAAFVRAVADFLETDADDILAQLGYTGPSLHPIAEPSSDPAEHGAQLPSSR